MYLLYLFGFSNTYREQSCYLNLNDLNLDFNEKCLLPNYNIDTPYSDQIVSKPKKVKEELKLEARFTALKNYIECEISILNFKFQSV